MRPAGRMRPAEPCRAARRDWREKQKKLHPQLKDCKNGTLLHCYKKILRFRTQEEKSMCSKVYYLKFALCAKTSKFKLVMDFVFQSVNFIRSRGVKHRQFQAFLKETDADFGDVLYHTDVRWPSRRSVLKRLVALSEEIKTFLMENDRDTAVMSDDTWRADLYFLTDITSHLNRLNTEI